MTQHEVCCPAFDFDAMRIRRVRGREAARISIAALQRMDGVMRSFAGLRAGSGQHG